MKIRELLNDESKWCKNNYARDKEDEVVSPTSPDAAKWCIIGAARRCYTRMEDYRDVTDKIHTELLNRYGFPVDTVTTRINDELGYAAMKNLVDSLDI